MSYLQIFLKRLPTILCGIAVYVIASPATQKLFTNNAAMVGFFTSLGIPAPEIMVIFVGLVELTAILAFITGIGGRFMALAVGIEMLVAMATAGRNDNNTVVFLCCVGILILGTGAHSIWQPAEKRFQSILPGSLTGQ